MSTAMTRCSKQIAAVLGGLFCFGLTADVSVGVAAAGEPESLVLVVMDPLSKPLSCDCVRGYAQRDYDALGKKLADATGRDVQIVWHQSLAEALKETKGRADLVVGKHSVVVADAKSTSTTLLPIAQLTGKDGTTNQHGLIVVRSVDAAHDLKSLAGYKILFGPIEAEEKSTAAQRALQHAGIRYDESAKRFGACSEAATAMLEMPIDDKVAAVISSYAEPLLKGCGSIREGELRIVGKTENVPFVTAFLSEDLPEKVAEDIQIALLTAGTDPEFLKSMETLAGFVPWTKKSTSDAKPPSREEPSDARPVSRLDSSWPQFRGPNRDGRVGWLPMKLPDLTNDLVWSQSMPSSGLGGIAIANQTVIVSGRDAADRSDTFTAFSLSSGKPLWHYAYDSSGMFDYGNTPRATPVINQSVVYTLGAAGTLCALDSSSGTLHWRVDLAERFGEEMPTWGFCSSPLLINDTVYVQLGVKTPLVAIDASTGKTRWAGPGRPAGYSSLISTKLKQRSLLVGIDRLGYFIRSAEDGRYLWLGKREYSGDFAVPAPVAKDQMLYFTGENNGIEAFDMSSLATSNERVTSPVASNDRLAPDSHTPVAVGDQLLVAYEGLQSLDTKNGLSENWTVAAGKITAYASIIASDRRALVTTEQNELILVDVKKGEVIDSAKLLGGAPPLLSHPAIADGHLVIRTGNEVRCFRMQQQPTS